MTGRRGRRVPIPPPAKNAWRDGWMIKCSYCDLEWGDKDTIKLDAIQLHFDTTEGHPDQIAFETVWRGDGPEPPKPVENRAMRRVKKKGKR